MQYTSLILKKSSQSTLNEVLHAQMEFLTLKIYSRYNLFAIKHEDCKT